TAGHSDQRQEWQHHSKVPSPAAHSELAVDVDVVNLGKLSQVSQDLWIKVRLAGVEDAEHQNITLGKKLRSIVFSFFSQDDEFLVVLSGDWFERQLGVPSDAVIFGVRSLLRITRDHQLSVSLVELRDELSDRSFVFHGDC